MGNQVPLIDWLKEHHGDFKDKEPLVVAACKEYPASTRKSVLNRIADLVHRGQMPGSFLGRRGISTKPKDKSSTGSVPRARKSGGKKVPKKFRMAVDASLVRDEWDDEAKIDEGLANLDGQVIKDNDFRMELGIAQDRWKLVSTSERYSGNKIELKGKQFKGTFWGRKDVIESLRKKVDMV